MTQKFKLYVMCALVGAACAGGYFYFQRKNIYNQQAVVNADIRDYVASPEQTALVKKQFKDNWYWLVTSSNYDVDHMLATRSPNTYEPKYTGKMNIKILYNEDGVPVGFGTYYMRNAVHGEILFIAVDNEFRGKHYAEKLVNHATNDLRSMGAKTVKLLTRTDNKPARRLYERLNFTQTHETPTHVYFRKDF